MKKVIIIGCPGSGKSTFARKLKEKTDLPLHHLDMLYWNEDRTTVSREIFDDRLKNVMATGEWIIDGNYARTMETRIKECDTVFFLDYKTDVCIEGIEARKGKIRSDMPWIETDTPDEEFVAFVKSFEQESKPRIIELLKMYSSKNIIIFHDRCEADEYLSTLEKEEKYGV
jgi:adenylate kinase family enzyme